MSDSSKLVPRSLLWSLLVVVLLSVAGAAIVGQWRGREPTVPPPPVMGTLPEFSLTDQHGRAFGRADLMGSLWVADFIFTRCEATCPLLTERLTAMGPALDALGGVRRISFSVDPEYDTAEVLATYAVAKGIDGEDWVFLTGETDAMYSLIRQGFQLGLDASPENPAPGEPIVHSTRFVLVDGEGRIRGYYGAFQEADRERLLWDLGRISREGR